MKLNIDFEDLVDVYEDSNATHLYFIDTKNNEIIFVNEAIDDDASEKLEELEDERYFYIPPRLPQDEFYIMEMFVYTIEDFDLAEKFHGVLEGKKPFRNFKDLLYDYPELRERWFEYKHNTIKNETINWLCENDIEIENQEIIPKIEIRELNREELKDLPEEIKGFGPFACLKCHNKTGIKARWFTLNVTPENRLVEIETQRIMKEKFDINHHGNFGGGEQEFLTAAKCPKCGSEEIFWDF